MRYLVYILIATNLAYFAWHQLYPAQKPAELEPVPAPPGMNRLLLLSERIAEEPAAGQREAQQEEVVTVQQPTTASVEQLAAVAVQEELTPSPPQVDGNVSASKKTETDSETGSWPKPDPKAKLEPEAQSEPEPEAKSESAPVVQAAAEAVCHTIGPLSDTADVVSISEKLSKLGFQSSMRGGKQRQPAGYWVYMPAMPRNKARSIVADLDAKGMKDYYIGRKNHISLGIFSTEKKAHKRLNRIKELGYDAEMGQRYRNRAVFWLDVREGDLPLRSSKTWEEIRQTHKDIDLQQLSCADMGP